MIDFVQKNNNKNLILFIHGLMGSNETWKNESTKNTFPDLLLKDKTIKDNYDIAYFEYYSNFLNLKQNFSALFSLFKKSKSTEKNLSIKEIANLLKTRIDNVLIDYENIVIIAHSMGGLIGKKVILDYEYIGSSKVGLFLSLAVPHLGSDLAIYGSFISPNIQIKDLKPFSIEAMKLIDNWLGASNLPITKYFIASYEGTVSVNSAFPPGTAKSDKIYIDENHRSIAQPKDEKSIVIISTIKFLKDFLKNRKVSDIDYDKILAEEYDDEYFVLKLMIADVRVNFITDSKKHFYYSEEARKIFTSSKDVTILKELYAKIESLYKNLYGDLINKKILTSDELVNEVHKKIIEEDEKFLTTKLSRINGLHKKGMIHLLANDLEKDIFWNEKKYSKDELNKYKG